MATLTRSADGSCCEAGFGFHLPAGHASSLGGGAAFLTRPGHCLTWRPWWQVAAYMLVLGAAVRFFHMRAVRGRRCCPCRLLRRDTAVCLVFGFWGFRLTRARQMAQQYGWIYQRSDRSTGPGNPRRQTPQHRNPADAQPDFSSIVTAAIAEGGLAICNSHSEGEFSNETDHRARPGAWLCRRADAPSGPAAAQIKIGVAGPLTGGNAAFGAQLKNGVEQAVEDINAAGGIHGQKITAVRRRRSSATPSKASRSPTSSSADGVKFVVGHFNSGVTMPASEVYQENGILVITPAATNPQDHRTQHVERVPHLRP